MDDREKAGKELGVDHNTLERYSFPQTFGSTAGPFGGIGGQMMTSMQIDAYTDGRDTVFYCCGKRVKRVKHWKVNVRMP